MRNKVLIILAFSWTVMIEALPQSIVFRFEPMYGTFAMKDLKKFQTSAIPDIGVKIESISKFPPYFGFGASLLYVGNSGFGIGATADYYTTGARNYYEDYSGSYRFDLLATCYDLGLVTDLGTGNIGPVATWFEIAGGWKISKMEMMEEVVLTEPVASDSYHLASGSIWLRPGFRVDYNIIDIFSIGAFVGGELNFKSKLHLPKNREAYLRNADGGSVKIDWTGVRLGLHVSASF